MQKLGGVRGWDRVAFAAAFQITMLEGTEVVFIVIAIGAGGAGLLVPASVGALAALLLGGAWLCTSSASLKCSRNKLKFVVGVLLSAFGTFWVGEGIGLYWPGEDWSILALVVGYLAAALASVTFCRTESSLPTSSAMRKETSNEVA
jgi:uncharacterized membrane protein